MISFKEYLEEEKNGLWANIHAKRKRIKAGSGERMRKPGSKGAPTDADFKAASEEVQQEATYQGRDVALNKPMAGDVKKSKVYVDPDGDGKAKKVEFGDPNMSIKKHIPARRKSFRARHNCDNPGPKDKARYWSCKAW